MNGKIVFLEDVHTDEDNEITDLSATAIPGTCWGTVAILVTETNWREPLLTRHYWTIDGWANRRDWEHLIGREVDYNTHLQYWRLWDHCGQHRRVEVLNTRCRVEQEDIPPPPRVRSELRWRSGHWEKYLKSKGWVRA